MNFAAFAHALLDPALPCPGGLRAHNGSDPAIRFAVYRNNVITSLVDALADGFPVVHQLVGAEFFAALARVYVARHPPRSAVLSDWGDTFAAFIGDFEPAATVPYLAGVARLERARVRAIHAADAPGLDVAALHAQLSNPSAIAGARVALHPSVQVIQSEFAVVSLWAAHQGHGEIADVDPALPEAALVLRADEDVAMIRISHAGATFMRELAQGATLMQSASCAAAIDEAFDPAANLSLLIRHRVFIAWHSPLPEPPP